MIVVRIWKHIFYTRERIDTPGRKKRAKETINERIKQRKYNSDSSKTIGSPLLYNKMRRCRIVMLVLLLLGVCWRK